ncbi:MAG: PepSY domain-containing protein [Steroidobacteraceae bacterium]
MATALLAAGATLTLAATGALAAGESPPSAAVPHHEESARLGTPPRADVKPFESAKLSLTQAISRAQSENRGKPLAARFEVWHGRPVYVIRTYSANQVWETRVDANSGETIGQPATVAKHALGRQTQKEIEALDNARASLTDAVNKAEQQQGGKVIMARVKPVSGGASYDIDLVKNGRLHTAMVDAQSGQLR